MGCLKKIFNVITQIKLALPLTDSNALRKTGGARLKSLKVIETAAVLKTSG